MAKSRRQVSIYINGREVENSFKGVRTEMRKVRAELNNLTIGSDEYNKKAAELRKLDGIIRKHRDNVRGTQGAWTKASAGLSKFVGVAAAAFTVDALARYAGELFKLGAEMEVLGAKAQTVFAEALPAVTAAAQENANAMGLTISQYTDAATAIGDLLVPMGFQREEAANISTELVNLSGALSEWTGGQVSATEVSNILSKAVLGEREQLKTLGIAISEADVQARLAEKGLKNLTGQTLQQAKAAATLELITEKSTDAQAAFAQNSDTLVRKQAELRARFQDIQENLASALIPVFQRLLTAAQPVIESFADFIIKLINGEQASGRFSGLLNILIRGFQNVGKTVSFVGGLLGKLVGFLFDNFGGAIEFVAIQLARLQNTIFELANRASSLLNIEVRFQKTDLNEVRKAFDQIRQERAKSGVDAPIEPTVSAPAPGRSTTRSFGPAAGSSPGSSEDPVKKTEQSIKRLEQLKQKVEELRTNFETSLLADSEQAAAQIEQRYAKELEKALELTKSNNEQVAEQARAQIVKLEQLKEEELAALREQQFQDRLDKEIEQAQKLLEAEQEYQAKKQEAQMQIDQYVSEQTLTDRELELEQLRLHYEQLLAAAQEYGINTSELIRAYREQINDINAEYNRKDVQERKAAIQEEAKAIAGGFNSVGKVLQGFQTLAEQTGAKGAALAKSLALTVIAAKTAEAIASGVAASAGIPFPANLPAIATTVATVLAQIAAARNILAQARDGGFVDVVGAQDGRSYNAEYIGRPGTGMLPGHPVVLASEKGPEYFVANEDLRNPVVLDHVRAIENIRRSRTRQFQEGGFTEPVRPGKSGDGLRESSTEMIAVLEKLNRRLEDPLYAFLEDQTLIEIKNRLAALSAISGGVL